MSQLKFLSFLMPFVLIGALFAPDGSCQRKVGKRGGKANVEKVASGAWGSNKALLQVTDDGAALDFACARGAISQPLVLGSGQAFDLNGSYIVERPGPQVEGENNEQPARFTGKIEGQTMTLTITLTRTKETIGPLILTYGKTARVARCQ